MLHLAHLRSDVASPDVARPDMMSPLSPSAEGFSQPSRDVHTKDADALPVHPTLDASLLEPESGALNSGSVAGLGSGPASPDPQVKLRRPVMLPLTPASHTLDHAHAQDSKVDLDAKQSDSSSYDTAGTNDIGVVSGGHSRGPVSTVGASLGRGGANLSTPGGGVRTLKGWLMCATQMMPKVILISRDVMYDWTKTGSTCLTMQMLALDTLLVARMRGRAVTICRCGSNHQMSFVCTRCVPTLVVRSARPIEIELVSNDGDTGASVWLEHTDSDSDGSSHARWLSHLRSYLQNQPAQKQQDMTDASAAGSVAGAQQDKASVQSSGKLEEHVKQHAMFAACAFEEPGESQETVSAASSQQSSSASGVSRNSDSVGVWKRHGGFGASGHSDTIVDDADGVSQSNVSSGPQITDSQGAEQVTSNDVNAASPVTGNRFVRVSRAGDAFTSSSPATASEAPSGSISTSMTAAALSAAGSDSMSGWMHKSTSNRFGIGSRYTRRFFVLWRSSHLYYFKSEEDASILQWGYDQSQRCDSVVPGREHSSECIS